MLKEICRHLKQFIDCSEKEIEKAQVVMMRYELEKAKKELENKKDLRKRKNKEIRMLRERSPDNCLAKTDQSGSSPSIP